MTSTPQTLSAILQLIQSNRCSEAEAVLRQLVQSHPNLADAWSLLGLACRMQDKAEESARAFERAARLKPNHETLGNYAAGLSKLGQHEAALDAYRQSLAFNPNYADGRRNLGICLTKLNRHAEAEAEFRAALRARPDFIDAMNNLWSLLTRESRYAEALELSSRIIQLCPQDSDAWNAHGSCLYRLNRVDESLSVFAEAVRLKPDNVKARLNHALAKLTTGDYQSGWPEYHARWEASGTPRPRFGKPLWTGEDIAGKRLLLWTEQGLGDTLHFIRYAVHLKKRGAAVILRCPKPLREVLARTPGIDRIVPDTEPFNDFDLHVSVVDLPQRLGLRSPADIEPMTQYAFADPELIAKWRDVLRNFSELRVGICWSGRSSHPDNRHRSFSPEFFERMARVPGVQLISLQKREVFDPLPDGTFEYEWLDSDAGPFMDTAAIIANLDLVISCDSAVGHLAGAMGAPTWLAVPYFTDWRWPRDRSETPWYPNTRLFRQTEPGDWDEVVYRIIEALRPLAVRKSIPVPVSPGEFFDRLGILEIKSERIGDLEKRKIVLAELSQLLAIRNRFAELPEELIRELKRVNEQLWDIEDAVRDHERRQDFGEAFVALARSVYQLNDRRSALKSAINAQFGSRLNEQKSHAACEQNSV